MFQNLLARARALLAGFADGLRAGEWPGPFGAALSWIQATVTAFLLALVRWFVAAFNWLFVPANRSPLDFLKHYASLIIVLTGFIALAWAGYQIAYPPLVITVAKLPGQLEQENWINPEMQRTLMNQIERLRAVVKGERDPAFEAVLNSPNISIKTGDFSLNVQEQILTPLGTLLGRGQGEVHLAVTCYHPGCARASDAECREPIKKDAPSAPDQYLCLRLTADIQRGKLQRRVTLRLTLNNDTYEIDMARQMSRIAEAVTSVADPATAALYFYRRIRQERDAARSLTHDPEVIAELRAEAFKAAEQAERQDTVSVCWAHSVRAHLAIDQREFSLAEGYLARAKRISLWDRLRHGVLRADCERLVAIAEMELSRQLARPADYSAYPQYSTDDNEKRLAAAYHRIARLLQENTASLVGFLSNDSTDLNGAIAYAQAEIGLAWFTKAEQCGLLDGRWAPANPDRVTSPEAAYDDVIDPGVKRVRFETWPIIHRSLDNLQKLSAELPLSSLTRQAAMDFVEAFAANDVCADDVQAVGRQLYLAHPSDAKVTELFARVSETAATKKSRNLPHPATEKDRGNLMLGYAKSLYERLVDIGEDKVDVIALSRLAFITEAFYADNGNTGLPSFGPHKETLSNVTRAWKRYQQQNYPSHTRHHAEFLVSFWGSLLLRFYPDVIEADLLGQGDGPDASKKEQLRSAKTDFAEFNRALRFLFPDTRAASLVQLPKLGGIGERIGCLCMLSRAVYQYELADFLIARIHGWQDAKASMSKCQKDLIPEHEKLTYEWTKKAEDLAKGEFETAERAFNEVKELEQDLEDARAGNTNATKAAARRLESALGALEAADPRTPRLEKAVTDALKALATAKTRVKNEVARLEAAVAEAKPKVPALTKVRDEARAVFEQARGAAYAPAANWEKKERFLNSAARLCRVSG